VLIVGAHLSLTSFTFANPPDPDWAHGLLDEGNYDDIVLAVMAMTAFVPPLADCGRDAPAAGLPGSD
jgi:hypothetical protein